MSFGTQDGRGHLSVAFALQSFVSLEARREGARAGAGADAGAVAGAGAGTGAVGGAGTVVTHLNLCSPSPTRSH